MAVQHLKPLSAPVLAKRYASLEFTPEKIEFMHKFCTSAGNLYGGFYVCNLVKLYRDYGNVVKGNEVWSKDYVKGITANDFYKFSEVAMRDGSLNYCIFYGEEIYNDLTCSNSDMILLNKEIVGKGRGRFYIFYKIFDNFNGDITYCLPEEFLECTEPEISKAFKEFRNFLAGLISTNDERVQFTSIYGSNKYVDNEFKGKKLEEIVAVDWDDGLLLDLYGTGKKAWLPPVLQKTFYDEQGKERNCADKFAMQTAFSLDRTSFQTTDVLKKLVERLEEIGVEVDEKIMIALTQYFMNLHNYQRKYTLRGWRPNDLCQAMNQDLPGR